MTREQPPTLRGVPMGGAPSPARPPRHETVLPDEPAEVRAELEAAARAAGEDRRGALMLVAAAHPACLEAWARLSELTCAGGDPVTAYAFARVAYHRGLDRLRREGWAGVGIVRWSRLSNRGFLRGLHALLAAAAALGETDESARCRAFLLELDDEDALGVAGYPDVPGPSWTPPELP